jgi:arabinogalactan oligomer/maltooligosaccharide transport system substrate-binding protein
MFSLGASHSQLITSPSSTSQLKGLQMKIRKAGAVALAGLTAAALLGISVPATAATTQTVTIWLDQGTKDAIGGALLAWDSKDKTVIVNMVVKDFGQLRKSAIQAIPRGTGPDILAGAHDWTGSLLSAGVIAPVSLGANASKFEARAKSAFSANGKLYGVPGWTENTALIVNKKKLAASAIDSPAEFKAAIAAGKVGMHIDIAGGGTDPYHMAAISSSFGIDQYVRSNGAWTSQIGFNDDYSKGGFSKYVAWLNGDGKSIVYKDWNTNAYNFQSPNSDVAAMISGPWGSGTVVNDTHKVGEETPAKLKATDLAILPIPSVGGKTVKQFFGVRGYWMSSKVPAAKKLAVGKVLAALAGSTIQKASFTYETKTPANLDALKFAQSDAWTKGFVAAGKNAIPMPSFAFQGGTWEAIGKAEGAILKGGAALNGKTALEFFTASIQAQQNTIDG